MVSPLNFIGSLGSVSFTNSPAPRACLIFISLLGWLIIIPPFILQFKTRNLPLGVLMLCSMISCMMLFLNSILWPSEEISNWWTGEGLCDVEVFLIVFASLATTGGIACLFRQLCQLFDPEYAVRSPSPSEEVWTKILERTLCIGIPLLRSGLYYIVAPNRYWILGLHGCTPIIDTSWPSIPIYIIWPIINLAICIFYVVKALYGLCRHYLVTQEILSQSSNRVKRLLVLAGFLLFLYVPYTIYTTIRIMPLPLKPFSWSRVHPSDWSDVVYAVQYYEIFVKEDFGRCAFSLVTFACFGFGKDANELYREIGQSFKFRSRMLWRAVDDRFIHSWRWRK